MEIILATGNRHKLDELQKILDTHTLLTPEDIHVGFSYEETDDTFLGNSLGKARYLHALCRKPVIADDSGLVVPALNGEPGVYSARYGSTEGGPKLTDYDRNQFLLERMSGIRDRKAFFVCCMSLVLDDYRVYTVQETFAGEIIHKLEGSGGFGYDPLFFITEMGKTAAQLKDYEKNAVSHRGKAGKQIAAILASLGENTVY